MVWIPPNVRVIVIPSDLDRYSEFEDLLSGSFSSRFLHWDISMNLVSFLNSESVALSEAAIFCVTHEHFRIGHNLNMFLVFSPQLKHVTFGNVDIKFLPDAKLFISDEGRKLNMYFTLNNSLYKTYEHKSLIRGRRSNAPIMILGKYYTSSDFRYPYDLYTQMILGIKSTKQQVYPSFLKTVGERLAIALKTYDIDYVTIVPTKPDKLSSGDDSMGRFLLELENYMNTELNSLLPQKVKFISNILYCNRSYPAQKSAGSYVNRERNVKGVFSINESSVLIGKRVLILDDVYTSGATLKECRDLLIKNGATFVLQAPLSITQESSNIIHFDEAGYYMRFNKTTGEPFFYDLNDKSYKYEKVLKEFAEYVDQSVR